MKDLIIVDTVTGEKLDVTKATDEQISLYLTDITFQANKLKKLDKVIKDYIRYRCEVEFEENSSGTLEGFFGHHRIRKSYRGSFDKKAFEKKGSDAEKSTLEVAEEIKKKYQRLTEILTFR